MELSDEDESLYKVCEVVIDGKQVKEASMMTVIVSQPENLPPYSSLAVCPPFLQDSSDSFPMITGFRDIFGEMTCISTE